MVLPELLKRTPVTLELIFYALLFQIPLGIGIGIWSARMKGRLVDHLTRLTTFIGTSSRQIHSGDYTLYRFSMSH